MNWIHSEFISQALEFINGSFALLCFCACVIFGRYLWIERHRSYYELAPVIAVLGWAGGDFIARFGAYGLRFIGNNQIDLNKWYPFSILVIGSILGTWGVLCVVKVFSPRGIYIPYTNCLLRSRTIQVICAVFSFGLTAVLMVLF
jgi:hypothetical protein